MALATEQLFKKKGRVMWGWEKGLQAYVACSFWAPGHQHFIWLYFLSTLLKNRSSKSKHSRWLKISTNFFLIKDKGIFISPHAALKVWLSSLQQVLHGEWGGEKEKKKILAVLICVMNTDMPTW